MQTTWRKEITEEMATHGDNLNNLEHWATDGLTLVRLLDQPFDNSHGLTEGRPFTLWTNKRVYFPISYEGQESCTSVSRHPDGKPTRHIGAQE